MVQAEKRTLDITTRVRDQLTKPFKRMGKGIATFAKATAARLRSVKTALFSLKGAVTGLALAFGARRLFSGIKSTADELDELVKTSQRIGVTVEALQELKFIAGLAGTELKGLTAGLVVFSKNIEQAREGVVLKRDAMRELGVTFQDVAGENLHIIKVLQKVSVAWAESTDATARNNAIAELFGRTGSKLGPILEATAAGIAAQAKEARALGAVFSREELDRAAEFNDALLRLTTTLRALADAVFIEVAPDLRKAFDELREFLVDNKATLKVQLQDLSKSFAEFILDVVRSIDLLADAFAIGLTAARTWATGMELIVLSGKRIFKGLADAPAKELDSIDAALLRAVKTARGSSGALFDSLAGALHRIETRLERTKAAAASLGRVLAGPELFGPKQPDPEPFGPPLPIQESERFAEILRQLEVQQLEGTKRQVAAITLRYDIERERILERADALRASDEQRERALFLLDAQFDRSRDRLEGGFFAGMRDGFGRMFEDLKDVTSAGRKFANEVGGAIANEGTAAINDWIDGTKSLQEAWKDLGNAILAELQRILVKTLVLRAIGGVFSFGESLFGGEAKAEGGITRSIRPPVKLKKYATGGIAKGPQFALFGEGPGAEAFVPLPDGRSIPVTMQGGGGGAAIIVVNNISAIDGRSVAAFFEANTRQLTAIYDRALVTRGASRSRVRGVR